MLVFLSPWIPPFRATFLPQATLESDEKESDAFSLTRNVQFAKDFGSGRKTITDTKLAASCNMESNTPLPQKRTVSLPLEISEKWMVGRLAQFPFGDGLQLQISM